MEKGKKELIIIDEQDLLNKLSELIEGTQKQISNKANSALALLFWQKEKYINDFVLDNKRAAYGKQILSTVATHLKEKYGSNFELRNIRRMRQFAEQFQEVEIVLTVTTQLSLIHFSTY